LHKSRGFTLIEILMAASILLCGLIAVSSIFTFAIRANINDRQMAVATALVYDKMEEFRSAAWTDSLWTAGAGSEDLSLQSGKYIRTWQVSSTIPRTVTVVVYVQTSPMNHRQTELARATTLVSPSF
jgi:prepilin-type N-terminal cleavage/methylation domain-containing protein